MKPFIPYILAAIIGIALFIVGRQTAPQGSDPNIELKQTIAVLEEQNRQYLANEQAALRVARRKTEYADSIDTARPTQQILYNEKADLVLAMPAMHQYNVLAAQLVRLDSLVASRN